MEDSDTFMAIIDEGRVRQARRLIVLLGQDRFGLPDKPTLDCLQAMKDINRLERIFFGIHEAATWQDLLDTP
jgi:hypothetical protein